MHWTGATAEKRQVPLCINKEGGKKRRRGSPETQEETWRKEGESRQREEKRREAGTLTNEEDDFRNASGRVCGEPVARRWERRSGSKCLFLSFEFPGSGLAAIPGTGVTFPAEPNEQGGKEKGGVHSHQRTHTYTDTHAYTLSMCRHAHTHIFNLIFPFKVNWTYLTKTHLNVYVQTPT